VAVRVVDAHEHRVRDRTCGNAPTGAPGGDDDRTVAEDKLGAMVADAKTLLESERAAEPVARLGESSGRVATYAQRIKNKTAKARTTARRPAAKATAPAAPAKTAAAAPKPESAAPPKPVAPPVASGELQRLKDELQHVNQEISRMARASRPDAARQTHLPEKQELLRQKAGLDRKIRAVSKT